MTTKDILKNAEFEEVAEIKTDSKNRVALGQKIKVRTHIYKVYQNALGQIILDPQVAVPASEVWLFENKDAVSMVRDGLKDAKAKRLVKAKEDYSKQI